MKKLFLIFAALAVIGCSDNSSSSGGGGDPEINPFDEIADTTITASPITSQDELFATFLLIGDMTYELMNEDFREDSTLKLPELLNAPAGSSRTLVNGISMTNYKGSASYDFTETYALETDGADGSLVVDIDITTDNNIAWKSIEWADNKVIYVPQDLTVFEGTDGIEGGEASLQLTSSITCELENCSYSNFDNYYYTDGDITVEKGSLNIETEMDMQITNLSMDVYYSINDEGDEVPTVDIDSASVDMDFSCTMTLVAAISSESTYYNGGKVVLTATLDRNIDGLNVSSWDEERENAGSDAYTDIVQSQAERLFGDFDTNTVSVTVYDSENVEVYSEDLTYEEVKENGEVYDYWILLNSMF